MILEDLKHIFRFQTEATEEYTPKSTLDYMLFDGQDKIPGSCEVNKIEDLVALLDNFTFEGYRDRVPLFLKTPVDY
jgi:hypothetical protein